MKLVKRRWNKMFAEFKHTLRRLRGQIIGWGIGLFLYGLLMSSFYSSMLDLADGYTQLLESFPKEMLAFFPSIYEIGSAKGYLDTYYFSMMHVIIGIFAVGACAGLLASDEEKGILDLLMAYPVSRTAFLWGRLVGFLTALASILLIGWLGWIIPSKSAGLGLTMFEILLPFLPLFAVLFLFGALAVMFSMLLPSTRMAGMLSGSLLVANFLLVGLSSINQDIESIFELTPLYFYQGGGAIDGVNWSWLVGLFGVGLVFILVAWWRFVKRDIRVGGEGGWRIPGLLFWRRKSIQG
jgi:ABC-2 type transport system permease protein